MIRNTLEVVVYQSYATCLGIVGDAREGTRGSTKKGPGQDIRELY